MTGKIESKPDAIKIAHSSPSPIDLYRERLIEVLSMSQQGNTEIVQRSQSILYEMLTRRDFFVLETDMKGRYANDLMGAFKPQQKWYRETRGVLEGYIRKNKKFTDDSNPGWYSINTRPEATKKESNSVKIYATIAITGYSFIQHIPKLIEKLRILSIQSDDIIKVKIPESLTGFLSHNDSIVIHFKKKENSDEIFKILQGWMQENNIHESERELGRTKIAADTKDASFTEIVAKNAAKWLAENAGEYDPTILASEAIKHTISLATKTPF